MALEMNKEHFIKSIKEIVTSNPEILWKALANIKCPTKDCSICKFNELCTKDNS